MRITTLILVPFLFLMGCESPRGYTQYLPKREAGFATRVPPSDMDIDVRYTMSGALERFSVKGSKLSEVKLREVLTFAHALKEECARGVARQRWDVDPGVTDTKSARYYAPYWTNNAKVHIRVECVLHPDTRTRRVR